MLKRCWRPASPSRCVPGSNASWSLSEREVLTRRTHNGHQVMPDVYRPLFSGLPRTGVFDPSETIDYLKQVRDKMLSEPKVKSSLL